MTVVKLVIKEIAGRKTNFTLGLISVMLAVAIITGTWTMLGIHDFQTGEIIAGKEAETRQRMAVLEDDYRKIMKNLGFNLLILPKEQQLGALYAGEVTSEWMPEEYVPKLAAYPSLFIRHMLPSLQQKLKWPETGKTIILAGIRGEVPVRGESPKEPIRLAVPKGTIQVGYELHESLNLKQGDKVKLLGRQYRVGRCNPPRGDMDDITIWIDLAEAQQLLRKPGKISAILALKCHCVDNDIGRVRAEVNAILPGTQVIEKGSNVLTRAEARDRAAREAVESMEAEKAHRRRLREEQERFAALLVPSVLSGGIVWVAFLFFGNVRERKSEIGILRAVGLKKRVIMKLFLTKALFIGLSGAIAGQFAGFMIACLWFGRFHPSFLNLRLFLSTLILTPLLAVAAAYIPATYAANQDPAEILKEG